MHHTCIAPQYATLKSGPPHPTLFSSLHRLCILLLGDLAKSSLSAALSNLRLAPPSQLTATNRLDTPRMRLRTYNLVRNFSEMAADHQIMTKEAAPREHPGLRS